MCSLCTQGPDMMPGRLVVASGHGHTPRRPGAVCPAAPEYRDPQPRPRETPPEPYAPAMALQPVEATLIAASVGSVTSTAAVVITHLLTRRRDRLHRIWDRRMDAYEEVLRQRRAFSSARDKFIRDKQSVEALFNVTQQQKEFWATRMKLEMFGSGTVKAMEMSTDISSLWFNAFEEWRRVDELASSSIEAGLAETRKWAQLEEIAKRADKEDQRLIETIRAEAAFRPTHKLYWWKLGRPRRRFLY